MKKDKSNPLLSLGKGREEEGGKRKGGECRTFPWHIAHERGEGKGSAGCAGRPLLKEEGEGPWSAVRIGNSSFD